TLEGSGMVTGSVDNSGGTVSPGLGGPGLMTITGNYTQALTGTLDIEVGGRVPGTLFDRLSVGGVATLGGTLAISRTNGFVPTNDDTFQVINYASHSGAFETITGSDLGNSRFFLPLYNPANLTLVVARPVTVTGHVNWQGRPPQPNPLQQLPMTL